MKQIVLLVLVTLMGCSNSEENATINLQKGDEFFSKQEYEVAEYYYEKIPDDSPVYRQAEKKLQEIARIKKQWVEKTVPSSELAKIVILEHTYQVDNVSRIPSHRLSLVNNTDRIVEYIVVEFTYYDKNDKVITTLTTEKRTPMFQHTQDVFKGIEPGFVPEEFARATAKIVNARFQ